MFSNQTGMSVREKLLILLGLLVVVAGILFFFVQNPFRADVLTKLGPSPAVPQPSLTFAINQNNLPGAAIPIVITNITSNKTINLSGTTITIKDDNGDTIYAFPNSTTVLTPGQTTTITWNQQDTNGDQVDWDVYYINVTGSTLNVSSDRFNIYGTYATATTDESGNPFLDDSGTNGDNAMFYTGVELRRYVRALGNGSYDAGILKLTGGNTVSGNFTLSKEVSEMIVNKALAAATPPCSGQNLGDSISAAAKDIAKNPCIISLKFKGTISGQFIKQVWKYVGILKTKDIYLVKYQFQGKLIKNYYDPKVINIGSVNCKEKTDPFKVNKTGTAKVSGGATTAKGWKLDKETIICAFSQPISSSYTNPSVDKDKCCGLSPSTTPTVKPTDTPAPTSAPVE